MPTGRGRTGKPRIAVRRFGFLVPAATWALWFAAVYGLHGAGCAAGLHRLEAGGLDLLRLLLAAATVVAMAAIATVGLAARAESARSGCDAAGPHGFRARLTMLSSLLFLLATLWSGYWIAVQPACRGPVVTLERSGGTPRQPPALFAAFPVARNAKGDGERFRGRRTASHRVPVGAFEKLPDIGALIERPFGSPPEASVHH